MSEEILKKFFSHKVYIQLKKKLHRKRKTDVCHQFTQVKRIFLYSYWRVKLRFSLNFWKVDVITCVDCLNFFFFFMRSIFHLALQIHFEKRFGCVFVLVNTIKNQQNELYCGTCFSLMKKILKRSLRVFEKDEKDLLKFVKCWYFVRWIFLNISQCWQFFRNEICESEPLVF